MTDITNEQGGRLMIIPEEPNWFAKDTVCEVCGGGVVVGQGGPEYDYHWSCFNPECVNNDPGERTGDDESPAWAKSVTTPTPGFHVAGGWAFERIDDKGTVRITMPQGRINIDAASWASAVASVSARGGTAESFFEADAIHQFKRAEREKDPLLPEGCLGVYGMDGRMTGWVRVELSSDESAEMFLTYNDDDNQIWLNCKCSAAWPLSSGPTVGVIVTAAVAHRCVRNEQTEREKL